MAAPSGADVVLYYSGGGSNSTTTASIGGAISSVRILSQSCTDPGMTGVTIDDGVGNAVGNGTLTFTASTKTLSWQPYLGSTGTAVDVSVNGKYFIQGAGFGGALCVTVVSAALPTANTSKTVTVTNLTDKFFADTTKAEADSGVTKYHCFVIKNTHATDSIVNCSIYIASNTPGEDTMALYLDPIVAGAGGTGPTAVANENTAPGGSTFVTPVTYNDTGFLNVGTLTSGQCRFLWVRQIVPAGITTAVPANTFLPGIYFRS